METLKRFRRQARAENRGRAGSRRRYSRELRELALRYRTERNGVGVARVASELGISVQTLHHWLQPAAGSGFRRVEVVEAPGHGELVVVTPGGWRIEGLKLEELSALLGSVLG